MAKVLPAMQDMAMSQEEKMEIQTPTPPTYPYGLCISLCNDELEKLGITPDDLNVGDMMHLFCLAKVTSKSIRDSENDSYCRIELQITHISAEDEEEENETADKKIKKLYKG